MSVVCCQVEVCATGRSLVQRSPTECVCDREALTVRKPWPIRGRQAMKEKKSLKGRRVQDVEEIKNATTELNAVLWTPSGFFATLRKTYKNCVAVKKTI